MWIIARDRTLGRVFVGGLGALGVGEMWNEDSERYSDWPGYDEAPERKAPPKGEPWDMIGLLGNVARETRSPN